MFKNVAELVALAQEKNKKIYEIMMDQEIEETGKSHEEVCALMTRHYYVMKNAAAKGIKGVRSHSGMIGGDAKRMYDYIQKGSLITDRTLLTACCYAVATNEVNAAMGVVCATPTAAVAEMAGVESKVPWDEVISAMYQIGLSMPASLRETSTGGLAATETGKLWKKLLLK